MITDVDIFRTPPELFDGLPDFHFEPSFRQHGDLQVAHLEEGEGHPVVMIHGEPSWSYIWRKVIPPIRDAGFRCIAPDHVGFGRSDKPLDASWHSLERHVEVTGSLLEDLDLRDVTMIGHDWGGPISMTTALAHRDRISRLVILDTAIDPGELWTNEHWVEFRDFVLNTEDLPVGEVMRATCYRDPGDEVIAAYSAPYPTRESKAALKGLPMSVPAADDQEMIAQADAVHEMLREASWPILMIWAKQDLFLTIASGERLASRIDHQIDHVIPDAGHGLQEDQGPAVGKLISEWLKAN